MSHSLRAKIKGLRYKGILTDKDCDRLCKALDNENVLEQIRAEIEENVNYNKKMNYQGIVAGLLLTLNIINKYKGRSEE
jgi:hypothetical protein